MKRICFNEFPCFVCVRTQNKHTNFRRSIRPSVWLSICLYVRPLDILYVRYIIKKLDSYRAKSEQNIFSLQSLVLNAKFKIQKLKFIIENSKCKIKNSQSKNKNSKSNE